MVRESVHMHIIWDWNGTLFDDLHIVVAGVNASLAAIGTDVVIDDDGYRDHYRRPVRDFYDVLIERPVTDAEWEAINQRFHDVYFERIDEARPNPEARAAITEVQNRNLTQSILSMWTHSLLRPTVARLGLAEPMLSIQGSTAGEGARRRRREPRMRRARRRWRLPNPTEGPTSPRQ